MAGFYHNPACKCWKELDLNELIGSFSAEWPALKKKLTATADMEATYREWKGAAAERAREKRAGSGLNPFLLWGSSTSGNNASSSSIRGNNK